LPNPTFAKAPLLNPIETSQIPGPRSLTVLQEEEGRQSKILQFAQRPIMLPMILLSGYLLFAAHLSVAPIHRVTTQSAQSPGLQSFITFFEVLTDAEVGLQLGRGEVIVAKDKARSRAKLADGLNAEQKLVRSFLDQDRFIKEDGAPVSDLRSKLNLLATGIDPLTMIVSRDAKSYNKVDERTAWYSHGSAFRSVLVSSLKLPGYSLKMLSPAVAYNLSPVLYDVSESPVYADTSIKDKVKLGKSILLPAAKLRTGDEILAFRDVDEKDWTTVASWRDLLRTPQDAGEDGKKQILLRIKRGRSIREVSAGYIASRLYLE
jgi:hypothetical protein